MDNSKLCKNNSAWITAHGVFIHPEKKTADVWDALTDTTIENSSHEPCVLRLKTYITDTDDNVTGKNEVEFTVSAGASALVQQSLLTYSPLIWTDSAPILYNMVSELYMNDTLIDRRVTPFGFQAA